MVLHRGVMVHIWLVVFCAVVIVVVTVVLVLVVVRWCWFCGVGGSDDEVRVVKSGSASGL